MKSLCVSLFLIFVAQTALAQTPFEVVSGCQETDYVLADLTSSVNFQGRSYTPKCLQVVVGSRVSIAASKKHPLQKQSGNPNNPIAYSESTKEYQFDEPGFYGYYCVDHGSASGTGMAGTIWVVEE